MSIGLEMYSIWEGRRTDKGGKEGAKGKNGCAGERAQMTGGRENEKKGEGGEKEAKETVGDKGAKAEGSERSKGGEGKEAKDGQTEGGEGQNGESNWGGDTGGEVQYGTLALLQAN